MVDITRTELGLIILFVAAVAVLVFATMGVLNPELSRGPSGDAAPSISPALIATLCLTLVIFLGTLVGLIILANQSRKVSRAHLWAVLGAIALFVVGLALPIAGSLGGSFARTGDESAYRLSITLSLVGGVLGALSPVAAAWFLFKPTLRAIPGAIGGLRAIAAAGYVAAIQAHTTLAERTFGEQTVYLPQYDVPLRSGPVFNWQVAGWAAAVLLAAQWALLLWASNETRVEVMEEE